MIKRLASLVGLALCGIILADAQVPQAVALAEQGVARILFVRFYDLWMWEAGSARRLTSGQIWRQPQWSPDGTRIAFVYESQNFSDVFVVPSTGGEFVQLTRGQSRVLQDNAWSSRPVWSPDGSRLAYLSDATSFYPRLWLMNADGSSRRQLPVRPSFFVTAVDSFAWAPSGAELAVTTFGTGAGRILRYDLATGATGILVDLPEGAFDPSWSPDGKWLAFVGREEGKTRLYVGNADGSDHRRFDQIESVRSPTWGPDGSSLAFLSSKSGSFELWTAEIRARPGQAPSLANPRQLTHDLAVDALSGLSIASEPSGSRGG